MAPLTPPSALASVDDFRVAGRTPGRVVRPATVEELQATLRQASAAGESVVVQGGRTAIETGNPPDRYDIALDTTALAAIVAHEPDDFTATVQGGVRFETVRALLAERGQFLPLDPAQPAASTIGGLVARGRGGLRRGAFGEVRDWLIGCTVVLSDGRLVHGGGRVVKNVSGYDLPKLFAGSWGTLGCIVEVSFKLRPLPARDATLRIAADDFPAAVRLGREIARRVMGLQAVVVLDAQAAAAAGLPPRPALLVRAAGMDAVVHATLAAAIEVADTQDADLAADLAATDDALWQRLAAQTSAAQTSADQTAPDAAPLLLRIGCPPPALPAAVDAVASLLPDATRLASVDGGLLWAGLPGADAENLRALRDALSPLDAVLTRESGAHAAPAGFDPWGAGVPGLPIMRRIKAELDPTGTLSPGRMAGGI